MEKDEKTMQDHINGQEDTSTQMYISALTPDLIERIEASGIKDPVVVIAYDKRKKKHYMVAPGMNQDPPKSGCWWYTSCKGDEGGGNRWITECWGCEPFTQPISTKCCPPGMNTDPKNGEPCE